MIRPSGNSEFDGHGCNRKVAASSCGDTMQLCPISPSLSRFRNRLAATSRARLAMLHTLLSGHRSGACASPRRSSHDFVAAAIRAARVRARCFVRVLSEGALGYFARREAMALSFLTSHSDRGNRDADDHTRHDRRRDAGRPGPVLVKWGDRPAKSC